MEKSPLKKKKFRVLWWEFSFATSKSSIGISKTRWSRVAWWLILFYCITNCFQEQLSNDNWRNRLGADGVGYYAYLPATFIYHDYSYLFITRLCHKYPQISIGRTQGFCNSFNNKLVNKYFVGEALAMSPFFLAAHFISGSNKNPADGYSYYYMAAACLAGIFYCMIGLWCILILLKRFDIKEIHAALVLLFIFFGTHLYRYALFESAMTHVYSFGFVAAFLLTAHQLFEKFNLRKFLLFAFLFAFIILIRPINFIVIFSLPFIAGDFSKIRLFFMEIFRRKIIWIGGTVLFCLMILIQLGMYHEQCGKWFVYAYSKEGFDFLHPHFFQCLFSYSNGLFVYTPLLLVSFFGIFTFYSKEKFRFFSFILFFCLVVWIISSWWVWTYGGAFSMRPLVEYIPFFALLLGLLIKALSKKRFALLGLTILFLLPLTALNQVQLWQYSRGIIGWDKMTKEKYWFVFLETRKQFDYIYIEDSVPPVPPNAKLMRADLLDFEKPDSTMETRSITTDKAFSGTHSVCLKTGNNHAPQWKKRVGDIIPDSLLKNRNFILAGSAKWLLEDNGSDGRMDFWIKRKNDLFFYNEAYVIHQVREENKWTDFKWNFDLPKLNADDTIAVYPRRDNWFPVYVDDLNVNIYQR